MITNIRRTTTRLLWAKKRSRCRCGCWVAVGDRLLWDTSSHLTEGCAACRFSGESPDQEWGGDGLFADDWPIFHV